MSSAAPIASASTAQSQLVERENAASLLGLNSRRLVQAKQSKSAEIQTGEVEGPYIRSLMRLSAISPKENTMENATATKAAGSASIKAAVTLTAAAMRVPSRHSLRVSRGSVVPGACHEGRTPEADDPGCRRRR